MQSGASPRQRDIFLGPIPFTDEEREKFRPVLVLSSSTANSYWADILVMTITSNVNSPLPGILIGAADFDNGGLPVASKLVVIRVFPVHYSRFGKYFGRLGKAAYSAAVELLLAHIR